LPVLIDIEAVLLFSTALVCCPSKFLSPRHISFAITCWVFTESAYWTSRRTAQRAMVTTATVFHHAHDNSEGAPTIANYNSLLWGLYEAGLSCCIPSYRISPYRISLYRISLYRISLCSSGCGCRESGFYWSCFY
jgi:hypothetical protein